MKKLSIVLICLGLIALLASLWPFGLIVKRAFLTEPVFSQTIELNQSYTSPPLTINTEQLFMLSVSMDVASHHISRTSDDTEIQYHFPIRYTIFTHQGEKIAEEETVMRWGEGSRTMYYQDISNDYGTMRVDTSFEKTAIAPPGEIIVNVVIGDDQHYHAQAKNITLDLYDDTYHHGIMVGYMMLLVLVGVLLGGGGGVLYLIKREGANDTSSTTSETQPVANKDAYNTTMLCHLSAFCGYIIPFCGLIAPLIIWQTQRHRHPYIDNQGRNIMNFRLSMVLYMIISLLLFFVVIGVFLLILLAVFEVVITIVGAANASQGKDFRYPLAIPFFKNEYKSE